MKTEVTFTIKGKQYQDLMQFVEDHKACRGTSAGEKFVFNFIPNLFGVCATVRCYCGKSLDLTDGDDW